jgi:hypothetical protein
VSAHIRPSFAYAQMVVLLLPRMKRTDCCAAGSGKKNLAFRRTDDPVRLPSLVPLKKDCAADGQ